MNDALSRSPLAYHLTFHPYGTWLPGDPRGWHRRKCIYRRPGSSRLLAHCRKHLRYPVVFLGPQCRVTVRCAIAETCGVRGWLVHALAVERDHVHLVVTASVAPDRVLQHIKSWATRQVRRSGWWIDHPHPWAEHGSTRYLFDENAVHAAIEYVLDDHHRGR